MPQAEYVEQLQRLAEEVMPAFQGKPSEVASAGVGISGPTGKQ